MNIVLIGYRGTGKTTVGKHLAQRLQWPLIDADVLLEQRAGRSIREIFATDGEPAFRELESQILAELVTRDAHILSLGGGVILRPENRALLKTETQRVVWLQASADSIYARMQGDATTADRRPALTAAGGYAEIVRLLTVREPLYRECADYIISTEQQSPEQVATEIVFLLQMNH
jgi:shikimate kinase